MKVTMKRFRPISNQSGSAERRQPDFQHEHKPGTDPFLTPDDYFDELPERVMDRIAADNQRKQENPGPSPILRRVWLIAAAAATIAVIFMMINPGHIGSPVRTPAPVATAANLSDEYDQTYADEALLLEENAITDKDISSLDYKNIGMALISSDTTSVTREEIIQYLLDDDYDNDLIAAL
jgi:hypothetical protein